MVVNAIALWMRVHAGLEIEREPACQSFDGRTEFVKLHAAWDVLSRFAEMTSMKLPMMVNEIELGMLYMYIM